MTRLLSALLLADAVFAAAAPCKSIQELRTGVIRSFVRVGPTDEASVMKDAVALLGPNNVKLGRLVIYGSRSAARAVEREGYLDHCSWEGVRTALRYSEVAIDSGRCPEVSEAIKIGSGLLLRTVDAQCRTSRKLLRGTVDSMKIPSMGLKNEILAVSLHAGADRSVSVNVFVRTDAEPTEALAKDILAQLKAISAASEILVMVRKDADFVRHCTFPSPYLFDGPGSVRTLEIEKDKKAGEATCVALDPWPVQCWAFPSAN